jgi:hypothetical protein
MLIYKASSHGSLSILPASEGSGLFSLDLDAAVMRQRSVVCQFEKRGSRLINRWLGLSAMLPIATEFCGAAK